MDVAELLPLLQALQHIEGDDFDMHGGGISNTSSSKQSENELKALAETLQQLHAVDSAPLAALFCNRDSITKLKDAIVTEEPQRRAVLISGVGRIIVKVWMALHNEEVVDIEGFIRVENRAEARRLIEDFLDAATDIMKSFAFGAIGKAPSADSTTHLTYDRNCEHAYCDALSYLMECYVQPFEALNDWVDALAAQTGSSSQLIHQAAPQAIITSSISLLPLVKTVISIAFKDRFYIILRAKECPAYDQNSHILRFVSSFMRVLLCSVTRYATISLELRSESIEEAGSIFSFSNAEDKSPSARTGTMTLNVEAYIREWINNMLLFVLYHSQDTTALCDVIYDIISMTQHHLMASMRPMVAESLLTRILFLLESPLFTSDVMGENEHINNSYQMRSNRSYTELTAWTMLMLRYIPTDVMVDLKHYYLRVLRVLFQIDDAVIQCRYFAEFSTLILERDLYHYELFHDINNEDERSRTKFCLQDLLESSVVQAAISSLTRWSSTSPILEEKTAASMSRFVAALCNCLASHMLPLAFQQLNTMQQMIHLTQQKDNKESKVSSEAPDLLNMDTGLGSDEQANKLKHSAMLQEALKRLHSTDDYTKHSWQLFESSPFIRQITKHILATASALSGDDENRRSSNSEFIKIALSKAAESYCQLLEMVLHMVQSGVFLIQTFSRVSRVSMQYSCHRTAWLVLAELLSKVLITPHYSSQFDSTMIDQTDSLFLPIFNETLHILNGGMLHHKDIIDADKYKDRVKSMETQLSDSLFAEFTFITGIKQHTSCTTRTNMESSPQKMSFLAMMIVYWLPRNLVTSTNVDAELAVDQSQKMVYIEQLMSFIETRLYQVKVQPFYMMSLQARQHQGLFGGLQQNRFDGLEGVTPQQFQIFDLLLLLISSSVSYFLRSIPTKDIIDACSFINYVLQQSILLLRRIERDYVFSQALQLIEQINAELDFSASLELGLQYQEKDTGQERNLFRLPTSPQFGEAFEMTLRHVYSILSDLNALLAPSIYSKISIENTNPLFDRHDVENFIKERCFRVQDLDIMMAMIHFPDVMKEAETNSDRCDNTSASGGDFEPSKSTLIDVMVDSKESKDIHSYLFLHNSWLDSVLRSEATYRTIFQSSNPSLCRGLFSPDRSDRPTPEGVMVAEADVISIMDDVFNCHFHESEHSLQQSLSKFGLTNVDHHGADHSFNLISKLLCDPLSDESEKSLTYLNSISEEQNLLSHVMILPQEKHWMQVSGSGDMLTVLATSEFDQRSCSITVTVRIINSSGFKIPYFTIHILLSSNNLLFDRKNRLNDELYDSAYCNGGDNFTLPTLSAVFDQNSIIEATGVEFFLPDAIIERSFSFKAYHFAPVDIVVRIMYPDLVYDEDNLFEVPVDHDDMMDSTNKHRSGNRKNDNQFAIFNAVERRQFTFMDDCGNSSSRKWTAVLDCTALRIPVIAMLVPYGHGAFSANSYWFSLHHRRSIASIASFPFSHDNSDFSPREIRSPGIPDHVMAAQWLRLGGKHESSVNVEGLISSADTNIMRGTSFLVLRQLKDAIARSITLPGGRGMYLLGMDAVADLTNDHGDVRKNIKCCDHASCSFGWSLQTIWGAEISILLLLPRPKLFTNITVNAEKNDEDEKEIHWQGKLLIRCSDDITLQALLADLDTLVMGISGGFIHAIVDD